MSRLRMLFTQSLDQGSLYNPGTTATEAEARKFEKYRELKDNGYVFQSVALEEQGSSGSLRATYWPKNYPQSTFRLLG